jgi:hypothetical protein
MKEGQMRVMKKGYSIAQMHIKYLLGKLRKNISAEISE